MTGRISISSEPTVIWEETVMPEQKPEEPSVPLPKAERQEDTLPQKETLSRRDLFHRLVQTGAGALAAAMGLHEASAPSSAFAAAPTSDPVGKRKFRYGMVIDTLRCVGCKACVLACKAENKTPPGISYTVVLDGILQPHLNDRPLFMTKPCFHCETPACTQVCPVGATFKREQDGIVVVDYDRCIGCRYCIAACPYGARFFDYGENYPAVAEKTDYANVPSPELRQFRTRKGTQSPIGNVRKCTFCLHLQDEEGRYNKSAGRWPACAKTCPGHAIYFGDFNDPESDVSLLLKGNRQPIRLKEELGNEPNVYYLL